MNNSQATQTTRSQRNTIYCAIVIIILMAASILVLGMHALTAGESILFVNVALCAATLAAWVGAILLAQRGRAELGAMLGLVMLAILVPVSSLILTGRGLSSGLAVAIGGSIIAGVTLPPTRARWFVILMVASGLASVLIDISGMPGRVDGSFLDPLWNIALVVAVIAIALSMLLEFRNYSLRTKLVIALVTVAVLAVGGVTFAASQAIQNNLVTNSARDLRTRSQSAALAIGITMDRNVDRLQTMSLDKRVQDDVTIISDSYPAAGQEREALIEQNGQRWASADPQDSVIRNALNGTLASSLRQFGEVFQGNKELFMTDQQGSVIAATDWQPTYNFSQESWWQSAYAGGRGGVSIGQPEFNPMINEYGIRIALPIFSAGRTRVVGVIHGIYTLTALQRALLLNSFGETGKVDLLFPLGQILTSDGVFRALTAQEFDEVQNGINEPLATLTYRGTPLLSAQGVVGVSDEQPEPYLRSSAWRTIATIQEDEALGAVEASARAALLAGLLAILLAIMLALVLAQFLTQPIRRLTAVADKVQGGDLAARAEVETGDEIGALAQSFNAMTARLQDTLSGLERRVTERTQELSQANLSLQSNSAYLSALSDTSTGLFERLDLNALLHAILERSGALLGTQHGFVFLGDPGENEIQMRVGLGLYDDLVGTRAQRGVGLAGTVWQSGQPMVIEDYQKWEGRLPGSRRDALRAIAAVPLVRGSEGADEDETVGVIGLAYTDEGRKFGKTEVEILQRFAQLASIALDNAALYANSENRVQELAALNTISQIISQPSDFDAIVEQVGEQVRQTFGADFGYLALYNQEQNRIEFPYAVDEGKRIEIGPLPMGEGITSQVISTGQPVLMTHAVEADYIRMGAIDTGDGTSPKSLLAVPIQAGEQVIGVLSVQRVEQDRPFTESDQRLLTTIAASVGVGIDNARLAQATQLRVAELSALNRTATILNTAEPLDVRLKQVGRELLSSFQVSSVYIALHDPVQNMLKWPFFVEEGVESEIPPVPRRTGLVAHMLETREPLVINHELLERFEELGGVWIGDDTLQTKSYLGMPLVAADQTFGVVALNSLDEGRFTDADVRFLGAISGAMASAIQNAQLLDQTQERARELDAVNSLAREITQQRSLDDLFQEVYMQVKSVTSADAMLVSLYDEETDALTVPFMIDEGKRYEITPEALALEREFAEQVRKGEPVLLNRTPGEAEELEMSPALVRGGRVSASRVYVPLMAGVRFLGMISLHSYTPNAYSPHDLAVLTGLASHIAVALENARLFEQTQAAMQELQFSEAQLGEALRVAHLGNWVYDFVNDVFTFNDEFFEMMRTTAERAGGYTMSSAEYAKRFVHPDDMALVGGEVQAAAETTDPNFRRQLDHRVLFGDGTIGAVTVRFRIEKDAQGKTIKSYGANLDITERKRAEDELAVVLAETQRLAAREREAAAQVMALNRRLTREGWRDYLEQVTTGAVVVASAVAVGGNGDGGLQSAVAVGGNGDGGSHDGGAPNGKEGNGNGKVKVPIQLRGEVIGEIELEPENANGQLSEDDMGLVTHIAENLGLALDNARLYNESQRRVTELNSLNRISQAVTTELEVDTLLTLIGDQLRVIFQVQNVYIALYDRDTQMISLPYFVNDNQRVNVEPIPFGEGITSQIIRTREPLVLNQNTEEALARMGARVFGNPAQSYLGVPIIVGDDVTGVISIQSIQREGMFDESNVRLMETVAATVGAAIQNAQLYGAMQQEVIVRQRAEEEIKLSLREKEVLLKEIHHRVKNNLQIITSLLNLQSAQLKDPESQILFRESQYRVRSMALIHEKLYQSKDLARIDFDSYVRDLMVYLFRWYAANPDQIRMNIDTNEMFLAIDTAIPCGLIISELVTNTIKYAFPDGRRGELSVLLQPEDDGLLTLEVSDNGIGLPKDFNWRESDSLGLQLVSTLSSQLHGTIQVDGEGGTSFKITFPDDTKL